MFVAVWIGLCEERGRNREEKRERKRYAARCRARPARKAPMVYRVHVLPTTHTAHTTHTTPTRSLRAHTAHATLIARTHIHHTPPHHTTHHHTTHRTGHRGHTAGRRHGAAGQRRHKGRQGPHHHRPLHRRRCRAQKIRKSAGARARARASPHTRGARERFGRRMPHTALPFWCQSTWRRPGPDVVSGWVHLNNGLPLYGLI